MLKCLVHSLTKPQSERKLKIRGESHKTYGRSTKIIIFKRLILVYAVFLPQVT